jgi:hypothetical protein
MLVLTLDPSLRLVRGLEPNRRIGRKRRLAMPDRMTRVILADHGIQCQPAAPVFF